jgi:AraC family transcriptional activator of pobA
MKKKLVHYDGLYGDLNFRPNANYIFLELIETRSKGFDWVIKPHIHSHLYQVFCVESGKVTLGSSAQSQSLKTPCILVVSPNTLHGLQYSANVKGYILTVSDLVFESLFSASPALMLEFETLKCISFSTKTFPSFKKIISLVKQIKEELFSEKAEKKLMLDTYLNQFFIALYRTLLIDGSDSVKDTNATLKYYRKFIHLVKTGDHSKSIPAFAKELGISAVHLNRVCNEVCGKSASLLIQEHVVQQAKNYLSHTSYTVAEIAYLLSFEYPNYFARLFKKLAGVSPKEYRRKL